MESQIFKQETKEEHHAIDQDEVESSDEETEVVEDDWDPMVELDKDVDPLDVRTQRKVDILRREIEREKIKLQARFLVKYSFREDDPFSLRRDAQGNN